MVEPADSDVRSRALSPTASFIVQAPAGSGKTELLIRRFLTLLAHVGQPEEIVAITFTRKAAAEMRSRIVGALDLAAQPEPEDEFRGGLWRIAQPAWRNDHARGWRLGRHPARLRIQTIDALCASLVRQMPWLSGVGSAHTVIEDATDLYREAALRTVSLIAEDHDNWPGLVTSLLHHVDNRVTRAVELLSGMLRHRDQWLRHVSKFSQSDRRLSRQALEAAWAEVATRALERLCAAVPAGLSAELLACANYAATQSPETQSDFPMNAWGERRAFPGAGIDAVAAWRGLADLLLRSDDAWRRSVNKRHGFPALKNPGAQNMRGRMLELLQRLPREEHFRHSLSAVRRLPDAEFTQTQWRTLSAITQLLPLAAAQLDVLFGERNSIDFPELNRRANLALGEFDDPSELALRLDYRIQHLLVDEFQDTSITQFELLQRLTAGWQGDDGRTLFLVGDPMQSIYRFRQAEVGLFREVAREGLGAVQLEPLRLCVNFRSDPALVEWVNGCFARQFPPQEDALTGAVEFAQSEPFVNRVSDAGVALHIAVNANRHSEARQVLAIVDQRLEENPMGSIAILVRSRTHLREIIPALERAGTPYTGVEIDRLIDQPVVQDLLSLTRALQSLADRTAWLSVLRAPWCGLDLSGLFSLASAHSGDCIWDRIQRRERVKLLDAKGQQRVARFVEVVRESLDHRNRGDLGWQVRWTWERLGGPACVTEHVLPHSDAFFTLLGEHDSGGRVADYSEFLRVLQNTWTRPEPDAGARLQLMTVHKAKGLEFDTVIIPGLERIPRREDAKLLLWEEDPSQMGENLLLATLPETGASPDSHYDYLSRLRAQKEFLEVGRLLYVGCTRARRHLHLLATVSAGENGRVASPPAKSFLNKLWHVIDQDHGNRSNPNRIAADTAAPESGTRVLQRLPADWRAAAPAVLPTTVGGPPVADALTNIEFSWAGEIARLVGILAHEFLQRLGAEGAPQIYGVNLERHRLLWRNTLVAHGASGAELDAALANLEQLLRNVAEDSRARWLFDPAHSDVHSEYGVSGLLDGQVRQMRIDRTFVDSQGVRWIVDFKTSLHEGGSLDQFLDREVDRYRPQLEAYARVFQAMEDRPICLGLYFPLLKGWREWNFV